MRFYHDSSKQWINPFASILLFFLCFGIFFFGVSEVSNNSSEIRTIRKGDRIGQLVIMPVELPIFTLEDCGEPDETDRGNGAFGSTGK